MLLGAQAPQTKQPPTFRAGTEIVHLDVSVLDKDRRPVRGLTAADFTIIENGQPQPVVAFSAIDVPDAVPPTARWMRDVPADVSTNQLDGKRLVVIVFDDFTVAGGLATLREAQKAARRTIDGLGPNDVAAVVFTIDNRRPQDFTTDRARLLAAIDRVQPGLSEAGAGEGRAACDCGLCSIRSLTESAKYLRGVPMQRKLIVYISSGIGIDWTSGTHCGSPQKAEMNRAFREAQLSNASIYPVDPSGLRVDARLGGPIEYLQVMAEHTGGRPIINHNFPEREVPRIFAENSSYYLLAYELKGAKPRGDFFRRLEVKVNTPGLEVRSRTRYYGEPVRAEADDDQPGDEIGTSHKALERAIAGVLPTRDVPLRVTVAPFAESSQPGKPTVAIVLSVEQSAFDLPPGPDGRAREHVSLMLHAFDPEGRSRGSHTQDATVVMRPGIGGPSRFEILTTTELLPGQYSLRLAAGSRERESIGSVTIDVEVPKFDTPLSMSGALVTSSSAPIAAPRDALSRLVAFVPTAQRTFARTDAAEVFVRLYDGRGTSTTPARVVWQLRDGRDRTVALTREDLHDDRFSLQQPADLRYPLPLSTLEPGDYLVTVEATRGRFNARRDVRFSVR